MGEFIKGLIWTIIGIQAEEAVDRIKNPPKTTPQPPPQPQKPPPVRPDVIEAFVDKDSDLQSLIGRYSNTINRRYAQPLDSLYNPQGQKFLRELNTLVKTKLKA